MAVTPPNLPPITDDVSVSGVEDQAQVSVPLSGRDPDGQVTEFRVLITLPQHGRLVDANGVVLTLGTVISSTTAVFYVPDANWSGVDTFKYAARDNKGLEDPTPNTATITITPVNDPPTTEDSFASGAEDAAKIAVVLKGADIDGAVVKFTIDSLPENGKLTDANGVELKVGDTVPATNGQATVYFVPDHDWNGDTTFNYASQDNQGLNDPTPAVGKITVTPVNDPPETADVDATGAEDTTVPVTLMGSDPDGTVVSFTIKSLPSNGTLVDANGNPYGVGAVVAATNGQAVVYFRPNAEWSGETTFDYASKDNSNLDDPTPATATVVVEAVNDPPSTEDTTASGVEDATSIPVTLTGADIDGTVVKFTITSLPANGKLTDGDGKVLQIGDTVVATGGTATVNFVPNANWNGDTTFNYASQDDEGLNDPTPATATISVTPVNDAPETFDTAASGAEDGGKVTITLKGSDPDGTVQSFTIDSLPSNGKLTDANGNEYKLGDVVPAAGGQANVFFTPDTDWNGETTFNYHSVDNEGLADETPATATVNITPVNDAPDTDNTSASGQEDAPRIEVTLTGDDPDGTVTAFVIKSLPANGTLVDGSGNPLKVGDVIPATGESATVNFVPNANWNGDTSFNYASKDNEGLEDPTPATANINVTAVNDPPDTVSSTVNGQEDATVPVSLSGSDVDGSVVSFTINSLPTDGVLKFNGVAVKVGDVIPANGNGASLSFTPNADWNGQTEFTYSSTDNQGATDPTPGTITINVASVNDAPDTANTSAQGIKGALNIGLNLTGSDPDGTVQSFTITELPTNGTLTYDNKVLKVGDTVPANGNAAEIFFTPDKTFTGTVTFKYASKDNEGLSDSSPATGTIVIKAPPAAPDPKPPETNNVSVTGAEDVVKLPITLSGSDSDGTVKSFTINDLPANGKLYDANHNLLSVGSVVNAVNGQATVYFTPNGNWNGNTQFHYASTDNDNSTDATPATAKITITAVNDGPETCDVTVKGNDCSDQIKVTLSGSDIDGKVVSFTITSLPTDGVLKDGNRILKVGDTVTANAYGSANVYFYPNAKWDGSTTFKYAAKDNGGASDTTPATVTIGKPHANDGPETNNVSVTGAEDKGPVSIKITGTDSDGTVTAFKINTIPANGTLKFGDQVLKAGDVINASGNGATLTFTPNANWSGSTSFQYAARDNSGAWDSSPATGKITITGDNDAPITKDITASGCEDGGKMSVCLAGTDADGKVVSFTITELPANGTLTYGDKVLKVGDTIPASSNGATIYFTPAANWSGTTTFKYAAKDNDGAVDTTPATAKIVVTAVNDAPTTNNVTATGAEDAATPVKVTLSGADIDGTVTGFKITSLPANGTFKDAQGNTLSVGSIVAASNGQAVVSFTPKPNFNGDVTFTYAAKDNSGAFDGSPATGKITITAVNDAPDAVNDTATAAGATPLKLTSATLLSNDTDVDGDKLTIASVQSATNGTVSLGNDGVVTFTAKSGYTGQASFTYTVSDGKGGTDTATVNVDVKSGASAPVTGPTGPGVHSVGWWAGTGAKTWDSEAGNATKEYTYKVDTNADGTPDSNKFLLIGDFNKNGVTDNGEHTYLISVSNAKELLTDISLDARVAIGKDLVAAWLNYLSDNPVGSAATANTPAWFIREGVDWLSQVSGTSKTLANGVVNSGGMSNGEFVGSDVSLFGAGWNTGYNLDGTSGIQASGKDIMAGNDIENALESYNNYGKIGSTMWANDSY